MRTAMTHRFFSIRVLLLLIATVWLTLLTNNTFAESALGTLPEDWAHANYQLTEKAQKQAFEQLIARADALTQANPKDAQVWAWSGIIKSSFAGIKGGLGALSYAKAARKDLEHSIELDATVLSGAAYTSLGTLYYKVPGWPIGFGDDKKAEELLKKAVTLYPNDIDSNYFYGDFLVDQDRPQEAEPFLQKAATTPARPDRPIADQGRRKEIAAALAKLKR